MRPLPISGWAGSVLGVVRVELSAKRRELAKSRVVASKWMHATEPKIANLPLVSVSHRGWDGLALGPA